MRLLKSGWQMADDKPTIAPVFTNPPVVETVLGLLTAGSEEATANTWPQLIDELLRILTLKDDWDGEGTDAPAQALVGGALTLAQSLQEDGVSPADRVIAGVNGTIYFEWHTSLGYQEIEVTSPVDAECRWVRKGSEMTEVIGLNIRS